MYNDKVIIRKLEVVPPIPDSMIPMDFCQKINLSLILLLTALYPSLEHFQRTKCIHYI